MPVTDPALAEAMRQHREQQHAAAWPRGVLLSLLVGGVLLALVWQRIPSPWAWPWLLLWALALGLRVGVGLRHRRPGAQAAAWLWRYRSAFIAHGVVWAMAAAVLPLWLDEPLLDLMVFALATLGVGVLITTGFDLLAGVLFAGPMVAVLLFHLLRTGSQHGTALGLLLLLLALAIGWAARRSQLMLRDSMRARLSEAEQGEAARRAVGQAAEAEQALADQHRLLRQLLAGTDEGFWFLDRQGRTTDLNPAMARLLGRPREAVLGHEVTDFLEEPDCARVRAQMARTDGPGGGQGHCELDLRRPDGSVVHLLCRSTALQDAQGLHQGSVGIWTDISERRRAELAWRDHERLTNSITDMVAVVGEDRIYRIVNDAWCAGTGLAREAVLGRNAADLFRGGADPERQHAIDECLRTGTPQRVTNLAAPLNRPGALVETTFAPFFSTIDGVRCVAVVSRDVTEREQARQALQRAEAEQRALLDAFPGLIGCLDRNLVYTYVNPGLAALLGDAPEQIIGRPASEVLGPQRVAQLMPLAQRALAGETVSYDHRHRLRDGTLGPYSQVTLTPGRDARTGEPTIIGFAVDITPLKLAEKALITARDEAENANRAKSQFLSQMSHELRTPLNAILGFGQLLEADPARLVHQQPWVQEILRGAQHLLELINQMLDLGPIESGELKLASDAVPLAPLADEALALVRPLADKREVVLAARDGDWSGAVVRADRTRLKQVLLNLLSNGIKYNRSGGRVWLECRAEPVAIWLAVHDDGPGLSEEQQARLFQPFERLAAAQSAIEGTGIGLALSRRLVAAMGGEVGVDSAPGRGSCFWLRLPLADAPGTAPAALPAPEPLPPRPVAGQRRPVLYVEDNPVNLVLMEAMLAQLPEVQLLGAATPEEGLVLARTEGLALVLLDIQLPGMSGFEVLARLREDPATRALPVVAVSANALPAQVQAAAAAGFDAYLTKPLLLQELLDTVRGYLSR